MRFVHGHQSRRRHVCSVDGCESPHRRNGLCAAHAGAARRAGRIGTTDRCGIDGCDAPEYADGRCEMHYARLRRGSEHQDAPRRLHAPDGSKHVNARGYVYMHAAGHPLASTSGAVAEHRLVLFDAIGEGPHPCAWCATTVHWLPTADDLALTVDHVDWNPSNNDPSNLVPACGPCNTRRRRPVEVAS